MNFEILQDKLLKFLEQNLKQSGQSSFIVGLSGGLDSSIVATLCVKTGIKTRALLMPSKSSNKSHLNDALNLCKKLNLEYEIIPISGVIDEFEKICKDVDKIRLGNLCARVRMSLLYDASARYNSVVVGTSNLSERILGYGTIYGDTACAFNPIGDILKTDLFKFAKFLNIDENIISKKPSADLWIGQTDEEELGYSYKQLDEVISEIFIKKDNKNLNKFDEKLVSFVLNRAKANDFKLHMPKIAIIQGE